MQSAAATPARSHPARLTPRRRSAETRQPRAGRIDRRAASGRDPVERPGPTGPCGTSTASRSYGPRRQRQSTWLKTGNHVYPTTGSPSARAAAIAATESSIQPRAALDGALSLVSVTMTGRPVCRANAASAITRSSPVPYIGRRRTDAARADKARPRHVRVEVHADDVGRLRVGDQAGETVGRDPGGHEAGMKRVTGVDPAQDEIERQEESLPALAHGLVEHWLRRWSRCRMARPRRSARRHRLTGWQPSSERSPRRSQPGLGRSRAARAGAAATPRGGRRNRRSRPAR